MKTNFEDIVDFHTKFGMEMPTQLMKLPKDTVEYRGCFMVEELSEYVTAFKDKNHEGMIDALIDLSYVIQGTALMHGEKWDDNHKNYSKGPRNLEYLAHTMISSEIIKDAASRFAALIKLYSKGVMSESPIDLEGGMVSLHIMNAMAVSLAVISGYNWQLHWDEVHKCNMAKERSKGADDPRSKRGSALDVVKPEGWVAPNHTPIIQAKALLLTEKCNVNNH